MAISTSQCSIDECKTVLAEQLKALGHPVRLQLVQHLCDELDCCCGELCACFDHSQSTISQHLGVLKDAGLLVCEKRGNRSYYALDVEAIQSVSQILAQLAETSARMENQMNSEVRES